jgi:hypothetical protein
MGLDRRVRRHPPFPPPGDHPFRDRHADTHPPPEKFSKLDGPTLFLAP